MYLSFKVPPAGSSTDVAEYKIASCSPKVKWIGQLKC